MNKIIKHFLLLIGIFIVIKNTNAQISTNPNDYLWRIHNQFGYLYGGPNDSLSSYIMTDLPSIYFNKPILTDSIGSQFNNFSIFTNNIPRITVADSTGFVGIGTTSPNNKLHVVGKIRSYADTLNNSFLEHGYDGLNSFINNQSTGDLLFQNNGTTGLSISGSGKITIGNVNNTPGNYKLYVEDGILAEKLKVAINTTTDWADYVFEEDYELKTIEEVSDFVTENKHLPNVPSAAEMVNKGLNVAEMDATLLEKVEEAYLYIIQLDERIKKLEAKNKQLEAQITQPKTHIDNE